VLSEKDEALLTPKYKVGDTVKTYARRFTAKPVPVEGVVMAHFLMEGHYPPVKYIILHNGVLCLRDDYTVADKIEDIPVVIVNNASPNTGLREFTYDD
jgi:hypothetical protein